MVDIFISHARGDLPRVQPIMEALEALGLTLFINLDGADGDAASVARTDAALRSAKAVLCFWSPRYFFFGWCVTECRAALGRDAMVAARLRAYEPSTPPEDLRGHAPFDLADWAGEANHWGWRATLAALSERVGRELTAPAAPAGGAGPLGAFAAIDTVFAQERERIASAAQRMAEIFANPPGHIFRDPLQDGGDGPALCVIPAGRFQMGSAEDEPGRSASDGPLRDVVIRRPFAIGRLAVTFEEYDAFCAATGRAPPPDCGWGRGKRPVINVSWADAQAYCAWLGKQAQAPYRLPSEAEWEYACRAGAATPYWWGAEAAPDRANFAEARQGTAPADAFAPNPWGLHQTHGNVSEWCADYWSDRLPGEELADAPPTLDTSRAILRGGSWLAAPRFLRAAHRSFDPVDLKEDYIGFRVARFSGVFTLLASSEG